LATYLPTLLMLERRVVGQPLSKGAKCMHFHSVWQRIWSILVKNKAQRPCRT